VALVEPIRLCRRTTPAPSKRAGIVSISQYAISAYHVSVLTTIDIDTLIADTEATILRVIEEAQDERTAELYSMVRYHMGLDKDAPRGKRLRPLLGLLAYQSIAGDHAAALPGAAAVEMGHNFSLVHDDIEDSGAERRHRPALWTVAGVPQAINTGDTLFTLSRKALHRLSDEGFDDARVLALMRLYDETCLALCEGQFMDIWTSEHDEWASVDYYFDMIGRKTASLIAGSAQAGAMLATDDADVVAAYRRFGWALGIAFQLNDDLLGIWGDEAATGKKASDIAVRKKTLPLIYGLEQSSGADHDRLAAMLVDNTHALSASELTETRSILERVGAREYTREQARNYRDEALNEIAAVSLLEREAIDRLGHIVRSVIDA
jgi:geranylgeranyl diphosphate synthase type I